MDKSFVAIIPARYASTRFPGKPLAQLLGKPLIQWVWERAMAVKTLKRVIIATDDERIQAACKKFDAEVMLTSPNHPSGTDRIAEVASKVKADFYLNLQGDEPLIDPAAIEELIDVSRKNNCSLSTLAHIEDLQDRLESPNCVKVITDINSDALYFSRFNLPYTRNQIQLTRYIHIGIYCYRADVLHNYSQLIPCDLERSESLEQLRALYHGIKIKVIVCKYRPIGVDTPEELLEAEQVIKNQL